MIYLELLIGFLKVGMFSFGGAYSAIPIIRDILTTYGWLTDDELTNMIAISESTPGPFMINIATYVGSKCAGIPGAVIATLTVALPAFLIILLILSVFKKAHDNKYIHATMDGLKFGVTGIILATGLYMLMNNIFHTKEELVFETVAVIIAGILYFCIFLYKLIFKKKLSPILLIVISAVCGIILF